MQQRKKSKIRDLIIQKSTKEIGRRPKYISKLDRQDCTNIFQVRARMMRVAANYKNNNENQDLKCKWCGVQEETQRHILTTCTTFKIATRNTPYAIYTTAAKPFEKKRKL